MKFGFLILLFSGSVWAGAIFVSPVANFKKRIMTMIFLPDIGRSIVVEKCEIYKNKESLFSFSVKLQLDPQINIKKTEFNIPFPSFINQVSDLDKTEIKCSPNVFKVSTWRLEGVYE